MFQNHECYRSHDTWTVFCRGLLYLGHRASKMKQRGGGAALPDTLDIGWDGIEGDDGEFRDQEEPDEGGELFARPRDNGGGAPSSSDSLEAVACDDQAKQTEEGEVNLSDPGDDGSEACESRGCDSGRNSDSASDGGAFLRAADRRGA